MFVVLVQNENEQVFSDYIPETLRSELGKPNAITLGAVNSETNEAAGVLISIIREGRIEILWFYTGEDFRRQGAASALLKKLKEAVSFAPELIDIFMQYPASCPEIDVVMNAAGFKIQDTEEPVYSLTLSELAENPFWQKGTDDKNAVPLEKATESMLREFEQELKQTEQGTALGFPVKWNIYDGKLSMVYIKNNKIKGVMLLRSGESGIILAYAYVNPSEKLAMPALLYRAGKTAAETLPPETNVTLAAITAASSKLTEKLFPELKAIPAKYAAYNFINTEVRA
jgi:hypothetical protein